ncbi:putative 1-phosphatidylinositol-3-phosphate 5-kinase FAB1C [Bidens hawaiensis]|uniref:putative 1-phosphatidylinositol-3-phosphate 5-kinase FAB1C n=1 Tax=Bidens hawaiensis TaxID=980011 RepID=UPI00404A51D1
MIKFATLIYWGTSDTNSISGEVNMDNVGQLICCECGVRVSESCGCCRCRKCSRLFCESCVRGHGLFVVAVDDDDELKSGVKGWLDVGSCIFCGGFEIKQKFGGKFSHKIHPCDLPSPDYSMSRSDEDEGEYSLKNIINPYSLDTSDVGSSPSDCPCRAHFTSTRLGYSVQPITDGRIDHKPLVTVLESHQICTQEPEHKTASDESPIFRDQYEPLDFENNGLIWYPLPLHDEEEEASFFSYADDDDEMGPAGDVFSSSDTLMSVLSESDKSFELKKPLENVVQGHFRALVSQLLQSAYVAADDWLDVITSLVWQAANFVKPDTSRGGSMDPGDYVKIKCIASGSPSESMFVKGVVCTKNIKHKRMTSQYKNPRLLILGGALEYQRAQYQLASMETLLQQEIDHLKMIVSKIEARHPNVLLVEKSVSPYAQEYLLAKEISLVSNVKRPLLERIARCTGTSITPSVDKITTTRLGQCELFRLEKFTERHEAATQSTKKPSKTLMFFDGCPRRLGCTVLLKGSCREELKKVKHVIQYAVFAAYHLSLETSFLADEGATLPKLMIKPSETTDIPKPDDHDVAVDDMMMNRTVVSTPAVIEETTSCESTERTEVTDDSNEYYSATDNNNQSILVSFSNRCVLNGNVCERSRLLRIKFYGCFDKPLGRYLQDDLFDQTSSCRSCNKPAEAHVICYTHPQGNLTINVKRLPSLNLPGAKDGKIWMWHRCLRCPPVNGVPPATPRVVMSNAAWGLSFGKFLELSFSNHTTANRIAGCGHSLQRDCLRFYGLGDMVVFFRYSPIDILSVRLPPSVLQFGGHVQQDWLKKEVVELLSKTKALYNEISDILHETGHGVSDTNELSKQIEELKKDSVKERDVYIGLLNPCAEECKTKIDIFELNRLRHSLTISLHVWDRRLKSLDSFYKKNSNVEVKHQRSYSAIEDNVDHSYAVVDPQFNQVDQTEETGESQIEGNASLLSKKIYSAWTGLLTQPANPHYRRLTSTPARVYSFDSAMALEERMKVDESRNMVEVKVKVKDLVCNIHGSYSQVLPNADQKLELLWSSKPLFSQTSFLPDGAHLICGQNVVVAVYENEPTGIISYALASKEYGDWFTDKPYLNRNHSLAPKLSSWQSFGSNNDFDNSSSSSGLLYPEPKSSHHLKIHFEDELGPGGKVKFSVTCYFAKQFDGLRKKCCLSEIDYMRSLSRCKKWVAQGGKSGAEFSKSLDERFLVKGVTKTELDSFEEFAPQYFKYLTDSLNTGSPTCLAKIVGIYQVNVKHLRGGKESKTIVMVMENLFFKKNISRIYDLKGSARSRYNSDIKGTMLDMNLLEALRTNPLFLGGKAKRNLERAVWNDTSFLASIDVMDYSLLVGVDEESKELVLGIIDYMRQYTWDKQLETWVKASGILGGPKNTSPTIISPKQYKRRFRKAMTSYFLTVPDQWS